MVLTERAQRVLALATEAAEVTGAGSVGTEHLMMGLLRETEGPHWDVLREISGNAKSYSTLLGQSDHHHFVYQLALQLVRLRHGGGEIIDGEVIPGEVIDVPQLGDGR